MYRREANKRSRIRLLFYALLFFAIGSLARGEPQVALASADDPAMPGTIPDDQRRRLYLPRLTRTTPVPSCPATSSRDYTAIPVEGPPTDHPDALHGDLNLSLRGYVRTHAELSIQDINGPNDTDAPQLPGLFLDGRTPPFSSAHRVYEWDWTCGEHGCRSNELTDREVTLLGLATEDGEPIAIPSRGPQIYADAFKALVLYAEETRITLGYTRQDSVAPGYAVHIEQICVDPNLLALYRQWNEQGRGHLPALRDGEVLGTSQQGEILVAVRDRGTFLDPRSRKDWWKGRAADR